jgi:hypothetical protein
MVSQALRQPKPPQHLQRSLSEILAKQAFLLRCASENPREVARCLSAAAPGVAAVFAPSPGVDDDMWHRLPTLWFPSSLFLAALRTHLGLPVVPPKGRCPFCKSVHKQLNVHVVDCTRGGGRQRAHTILKQSAFAAASAAQWAPRLETTPFTDDSGRIDLDCFWLGENILADTAVVSVGPHLAAAAKEGGGAATAYEQKKIDRYGKAAARTNPAIKITPTSSRHEWHVAQQAALASANQGSSAFFVSDWPPVSFTA